MWSKRDTTEMRIGITEITYDDVTIITVATKDAQNIIDYLNQYECLKQTLDFEYQLYKKALNDEDLNEENKQHYKELIEYFQLIRVKYESLVNKTKWGVTK